MFKDKMASLGKIRVMDHFARDVEKTPAIDLVRFHAVLVEANDPLRSVQLFFFFNWSQRPLESLAPKELCVRQINHCC